jgi:hypothetical protein
MPFLAAVKEAKMRGFVAPGELLTIHANLVHEGSGYSITEAKIRVDGKLRSNATLTFSHIPFPSPDLRVHMDAEAERIGFPQQAITHDLNEILEFRIGRGLDHRHWSCHLARRRAGRELGRAQRAAHQRR